MYYTENHRLPQWVSSDRVRMEDFNQMNQRIEAGLTANAAAASAAFSPDNMPFAAGTYTGDGKNKHIDLPFAPSVVIVCGMTQSDDPDNVEGIRYFTMTGRHTNVRHMLQVTTDGFNVYPAGNGGFQTPSLNEPGRLYDYIAFK